MLILSLWVDNKHVMNPNYDVEFEDAKYNFIGPESETIQFLAVEG